MGLACVRFPMTARMVIVIASGITLLVSFMMMEARVVYCGLFALELKLIV